MRSVQISVRRLPFLPLLRSESLLKREFPVVRPLQPFYAACYVLLSRRTMHDYRRNTTYEMSLWPFVRHRAVFIHVPKAAGVSLALSLFNNLGGGHRTLRDYERIFGFLLDRFFVFTFVRNPFDRLRSAFDFLQQGGMTAADREWVQRYLPRDADLRWFVLNRLGDPAVREWHHFRPQVDFLTSRDGELGVDFIGRYENLAADFEHVRRRLGTARPLQRLNTTEASRSPVTWDAAMIDVMRDAYAADFSVLGYSAVPA